MKSTVNSTKNKSRVGLHLGEKIKIQRDGNNTMGDSSYFNSMNYLNNLNYQADSRNQSSSKVKKSANSISYVNNSVAISRAVSNSRGKRSSDVKIKSVQRSFSRRKHQTEKTVTAESGSHNASAIGFNPKMSRQTQYGALYSKIKNKELSYFGLKGSGKKNLVSSPEDYIKEHSFKKELLLLNNQYTDRDYSGVITSASTMVKDNRNILDDPTVRFLIAMSYYKMDQYDLARLQFEELLKIKEKYKKSVYVFLAICLNNLKRTSEAENILERGCLLYPKFYEAKVKSNFKKVYHAKILTKEHRFEEALQKFHEASLMESKNKFTVTLGLADCHRLKGDFRKALEYYSFVELNQPILRKEIGIKKAICMVELKLYDKAIIDLDLVE